MPVPRTTSVPTSPAVPVLRVEHHPQPALGIDEDRPRLGWAVATAPSGYRQDAYEVRWETGLPGHPVREGTAVVASAEQVLVPWPGPPLAPRERAVVRVRARDGATGAWGGWSEPVVAERGLATGDWRARPVGPGYPEGDRETRRAPLVRGEVTVPGDVVHAARLHVTAHGLTEVELNGTRVGADTLLPGWTPYDRRLRVHTYDVTELVRPGANALGAWLADGWFRGRFGFEGGTWDIYGTHVALIAQLEVTTDTGTVVLATDEGWRSAPGPLTRASLYDGETLDARLHPTGWSETGFDDTGWHPVTVHDLDPTVLAAPDGPPVRCTQELAPVSVTRTAPGTFLLDLGQNHSGRLRLRIPAAEPGTIVRVRHAEVLQDGALYTRTLREAAATDEHVGAGPATTWEPRFTVHGFRYAEISGWPAADLAPGDVVSRVLHSDMTRTGWFACSDPAVERLHENVVWSLRSNFVDIPTDCPQRDERLGWTGDIQVFTPTAAFLYDVGGFLADWLRTLSAEQERFDGTAPVYAPWIPGGAFWRPDQDIAGWGDAAVLVPWALHERTGDTALLARQYPGARAWVDRVARLAGPSRLWDTGLQLGDWLDPTAPPEDPLQARTDPHLVATAYFARSARVLAQTAAVLGDADGAERYGTLADQVRAAYQGRYLSDDPAHDTQTAHALALAFDLLPDAAARRRVRARLAALVRENGGTVGTGFAGTSLVTDALSGSDGRLGDGRLDDAGVDGAARSGSDAPGPAAGLSTAYALLLGRTAPSWLAMVDLGATTIWERWDSMLPDGTVNPGDMTSFNHYALGSVADWLHRVVAGLAPAEPGYRRIRVAPRPGGGLTSASARHLTPYGEAAVGWELAPDALVVRVTVPVGSTAELDLPGGGPVRELGHGQHEVRVPR
jgi:alpha-L-rhamnosidase